MRNRYFSFFLFILAFLLLGSGCGPTYYYTTNPVTGEQERWTKPQFSLPFHHKKIKKRKLIPPIAFISGMESYRLQAQTFLINIHSFAHFNEATKLGMQSLRENQYGHLKIAYWSRDSFQLAWEHPPVYKQYIFGTDLAATILGTFTFTFNDKDSSFTTTTFFD